MISDEQFQELADKVDGITSVLQRLADESGKAAFMEKHSSKWDNDEGIGEAIYGEIQGMEKGEGFDEDKVIIDMLTSLKADTDALASKLSKVEQLVKPAEPAPEEATAPAQAEAPAPAEAEAPAEATAPDQEAEPESPKEQAQIAEDEIAKMAQEATA